MSATDFGFGALRCTGLLDAGAHDFVVSEKGWWFASCLHVGEKRESFLSVLFLINVFFFMKQKQPKKANA